MTATDVLEAVVAIPEVRQPPRDQGRLLRYGRRLLAWAISLAVLLGTWQLFLILFHIDHFVGKTPLDVWRFLTASSTAAAPQSLPTRGHLWPASLTTLKDAFVGLAAGTIAALACSIIFNLRRSVEQTVMPIAMVLRSVPLVAMTPLITLVFGRGLMGVTVIAGIVTFFPTLVNVTLALRATPQASIDLFRAYGAGPLKTMRKVQLPNALPAIFASLRIAAPLALIGALLAEWLATGHGLGYLMLQSSSLSNYNMLWSTAALVTAYSMLLYASISSVEKKVLRRYSDNPI
ncbi:MAG TPA: ABC transporter permease [Acidimicrobiia bacterium]|nr:ABC transporter permease [Acidimicrobiia bacterium]